MNEIAIVEWTDEDVPRILDLTQATLGTGGAVAKTEAFWRWKHQDNPFGRSYGVFALDEAEDRIAALRVLLRWGFCSPGGDTLKAARAVDTATHPDYQRRGLFSQLTYRAVADLCSDGTQIIFNTPNDKSLPGYLKMGWSLVDRRAVYVRAIRPGRMMRRRIHPVSPAIIDSPDAFFAEGAIKTWGEFIGEYGEEAWNLVQDWESSRVRCGWRTVRSEAYYAWRYGQHPNVTYYVHPLLLSDRNDTPLAGFAVLRPNVRFGWQEVVLCDMVLGEPSYSLGQKLMRSLVQNLLADYVIAHFAPGTVEYDSIHRSRFLRAGNQGMQFAVRPLDEGLAAVCSPGAWDLCLGDLEIF